MERLNLFNPFNEKPPEYEDRLTWAFLVTLKYDPLLQKFLRELVESKLPPEAREHNDFWEPASVATQTKGIVSSTSRLVSILLTDKRDANVKDIKVGWSDREPVYDGVIEYSDGLTMIVENKPSHGDVWEKQLSPSLSSFSGDSGDVFLHPSAICLEWSEILEGVLKYADSGIAPFSSRGICRDFLSFVGENHPGLTPYRTFRLCGNRLEALRRRTIQLLHALASKVMLESRDDWYLFRHGKIAERVGIKVVGTEPMLQVSLWPADTVSQARRFYEVVDKAAFLALDMHKWEVEPNLHFSFMRKHLIWAETRCTPEEYFDYFADEQPYGYGQMNQAELVPLAKQWENEGLITRADRKEIEYQFNSTNRGTLNVIPGFEVYRVWDLNTVIELEERVELETTIIDALAAPLKSWGEILEPNRYPRSKRYPRTSKTGEKHLPPSKDD